MEVAADIAFEVSWEVCNKVGGIFTVVSSKVVPMLSHYKKENYFLVGPYFIKKAYGIFEEALPPDGIKRVFEKLRQKGIECHYGTWLTDGNPNTILVDFSKFTPSTNQIKTELWDWYKIDSLGTSYFDFDEPVVWSRAVGMLIEELANAWNGKKIVAHFHEWLAGSGLLYLKHKKAKVGTVFTTHATMLGRTLSSKNVNLYSALDSIDPMKAAYENAIHPKFLMEKACAANADAFTTVSEITGIEAEKLLGRKPDVLLLNGLNISNFPSFEEVSIKHKLFKSKMKEFMLYYFFPYYSFDIEDTLIFFIAGRYEFHDKGIDIFIRALGDLNKKLKEERSSKTVVAFFFVPGNIRGIKPALLESKTLFYDLKDGIDDDIDDIKNRIIYSLLAKKKLAQETLLDFSEIRKKILKIAISGIPPLSTHDLHDEDKDEILNALIANSLFNKEDDRIKVIYYPIYLTGADGLLDTSYYESMLGSHLGVFPSYYEPWGYTPLEAAALGVGSVTTDLSGFGRYIAKECPKGRLEGIFVLKRFNKSDAEVTEELSKTLYNFTSFSKQQRVENKIVARSIAQMCDWKNFVRFYIEAHNLAVSRVG